MDHCATSDFMAHGYCFLWEPRLVLLHVISDILTGVAYYSIPIALFYFVFKRRDLPFLKIFILFGVFIFSCGTTHLLAAYTVYVPEYWYEGIVKAITAAVSLISAFLFIPLIPKAIAMPSLTKALEDIKGLNDKLSEELEERKQAEKALNAAEMKYRKLLEDIHLVAVILDLEGNITFCNNYLLNLTGWTREEVLGRKWFDVFLTEDVREAVHEIFISGVREGTMPLHYENPIVTREGTPKLIVWDNSILRDSEGILIGVASIGTDITEHRKLEEQFRQSQKMESIGTLAGGVAHDFNNILTAIIGYGHMTLRKMGIDDPNRSNIEQILQASDRAAHLTKDLLLFSRKQPIERKPFELNEGIQKLAQFLVRVIGEDIDFKTSLSGTIPVFADENQIGQVLMNLATNAHDSMPKGGAFSITTEQVYLDEVFTSKHGLEMPGTYVMISVSDTGFGMDAQTLQRIFEPFYTTKEVGKGTGLGLAVVYGIIKQHEGYINVYSEPGIGTTFRIYLPIIDAEAASEKTLALEEEPVGGTETILLAEDNESVRNMTKAVLQEFGYTVITAVDGEDAVVKYLANKDSIQVLLFDLIMPKKNGKEAYDEIRKIQPDIKTIFASGYSPDIVQGKASLGDDAIIVYKPITPKDLLKKVRGVLDVRNT